MALGYRRKKLDLLAKILHMIRRRKKLEDIVSLETYGAMYGGHKDNHP